MSRSQPAAGGSLNRSGSFQFGNRKRTVVIAALSVVVLLGSQLASSCKGPTTLSRPVELEQRRGLEFGSHPRDDRRSALQQYGFPSHHDAG